MDVFEPFELEGTPPSSPPAGLFPPDFTSDERAFAEALHQMFSPEREDLPPLYVPTLTGDVASRPIDPGFEQKMTYRVLGELGLPRSPLFDPPRSPAPRRPAMLRRLGRSGAVLTTFALIFMALSVVFAGPSFAQGLLILLGHTGVEQVKSYPTNVRPSASMVHPAGSTGFAQQPLNLIDWFGPAVGKYTFASAEVFAPQEWSAGPIVDLHYTMAVPAGGSGELTLREFRIAPTLSSVLQVVADGSATTVQVGNGTGVYVQGQWVHEGLKSWWHTGIREELITERDGLIFWVVADQRDGVGASDLVAAAQQLTSVPLSSLLPARPALRTINQDLRDALTSASSDDVFALVPIQGSAADNPATFVTYAPATSPVP
jgi:hypothetical protein